jgi:hypothetical protein
MNDGNRPRSGLGAELSLWMQAVAGSARDLRRRRELRRIPAAAKTVPPAADPRVHAPLKTAKLTAPLTGGADVISRGARAFTGRRIPVTVAVVIGVAVPAWAVVNAISAPSAHSPRLPGTDQAGSPAAPTQQGDVARSSDSAMAPGGGALGHADSGVLPPAPVLPAAATSAPTQQGDVARSSDSATAPGGGALGHADSGVLPPAPVLPAAATSAGSGASTSPGMPPRNARAAGKGAEPVIRNHAHAHAVGGLPDHVAAIGTAAAAHRHHNSDDPRRPAPTVGVLGGAGPVTAAGDVLGGLVGTLDAVLDPVLGTVSALK